MHALFRTFDDPLLVKQVHARPQGRLRHLGHQRRENEATQIRAQAVLIRNEIPQAAMVDAPGPSAGVWKPRGSVTKWWRTVSPGSITGKGLNRSPMSSPRWIGVLLSRWAAMINPLLRGELSAMGYYWVADQVEYATDIAFTDRKSLAPLYKKLLHHAMSHFGAEDVMGFLGRKLHGRFQGELVSDLKDRWYGRRIKHRAKRNWIKMYDKQGLLLRVETVINHPYEFKVRRKGKREGKVVPGWFPLNKGVGYLYRFAEVALAANRRYLEALSVVTDPRKANELVRQATRRKKHQGRSYAGLNPASEKDRAVFRAVLHGSGHLQGFANREVCQRLYGSSKRSRKQTTRLRSRTGRDLKRLHVHGLIRKIKDSRKWTVTKKGHAVMSMLLTCHDLHYHQQLMTNPA